MANVEQRQLQEAERQYQTQLQELETMGFPNCQRNLRALMDTGGDLNAAVNLLL
jgi:ubiquilin